MVCNKDESILKNHDHESHRESELCTRQKSRFFFVIEQKLERYIFIHKNYLAYDRTIQKKKILLIHPLNEH